MPDKIRRAATRLIAEYPLAWVIARDFSASPLPLLAELNASGDVAALLGHCATRNPLVRAFREDPRGLILFNGPSGYVSPDIVGRSDWAPTWNFASLRFEVEVKIVSDETEVSLERLLDQMEGSDDRWSVAEMGPRYEQMLRRITAFRARVVRLDPHLKLGQDEQRRDLEAIIARHPDRALADWMTALNDRPTSSSSA